MSGTLDDPMLLAAEYALGTLNRAEMRQAESQAETDPAFAAELQFWQDRLAPLSYVVAPVEPPAALWARLALATGIGARAARPASGQGFWKGATAVSLAVAAGLALFAFIPRPPAPLSQQTRFATALAPLSSPARFLVETRPDGTIGVTSLDGAPAPAGRAYQLWALPQGATVPVSLGVLPPGQRLITPPAAPLRPGTAPRLGRASRRFADRSAHRGSAVRRQAGAVQPGNSTRSITKNTPLAAFAS